MRLKLVYRDDSDLDESASPSLAVYDTTHATPDFPNGIFLIDEDRSKALELLWEEIGNLLGKSRSKFVPTRFIVHPTNPLLDYWQ